MPSHPAELALSPEGHVYLDTSERASEVLSDADFATFSALFMQNKELGLLHVGIQNFSSPLPPSFHFWQTFVRLLITALCKQPHSSPPPGVDELQEFIDQAPCTKGVEYLSPAILEEIWKSLSTTLHEEVAGFSGTLQEYLHRYNSQWNMVGRICFHLAENKNNATKPFAFLATYTTKLSQSKEPQHLPINRALQEYAGERDKMLSLLLPVQKASSFCPFVKNLVDSGAIFQPQAWSAHEAHLFLKAIPVLEQSGIMVRVPNWWNPKSPPRPKVKVTMGKESSPIVGFDAVIDFNIDLALGDGDSLTQEELQELLSTTAPLIKVKGEWVEVDQKKIQSVLDHWKRLQKYTKSGLSMTEALRFLAGFSPSRQTEDESEEAQQWSVVHAGPRLKTILDQLKNPSSFQGKHAESILQEHFRGTLRPYQHTGVEWLYLLYQLKLGGCLADDMGLGKTIQILSLLLVIKHLRAATLPHLLVVPASLIRNWQEEIARFAPSLTTAVAHSSVGDQEISAQTVIHNDLVITTYGFLVRTPWLAEVSWDMIILDEAQAIKNPETKQTRAVKALKGQVKMALTGTPIENRLSDLWSLFDFTSPGLLGSNKSFADHAKKFSPEQSSQYLATIRTLTQPYILRRLKTDKRIITDLPSKTEMHTFCSLSRRQVSFISNRWRSWPTGL